VASVNVVNLKKSFGDVHIIKGVNIDIKDGEFVILVGPSGCGKSTLLRMIAGLEEISDGDLYIGDKRVNQLQPKARDIAMVFQSYALYPHMTVAENMAFSLKMNGAPKDEIDQRVANAAKILSLEPLLERQPKQLSGGQRQRVAMGRAIVRDPQVFLFDEPLSNLDAKLRVQMRTEIKALHQRLGTTMIYVTHDQIEAMTMADRIVVLNEGMVSQVGAPLELYDRPANVFVAGFIGSPAINLFHGKINGGVFQANDGPAFSVPNLSHIAAHQEVILGIRPEHFRLTDSGPSALVEVVEPTGSETQVFATIAHHKITALFRERIVAKPGEALLISPELDKVHLFDAATGLRLN